METARIFKKIITGRWVTIGVILLALYALTGFFILPYLARRYIGSYVEDKLGRELDLEKVSFNPFSLTLGVVGFAVKEKNGSALGNFDLLSVNFNAFSSIYHRAWCFSHIRINDPHLNVIIHENGKTNLLDLLKDMRSGPQKEQGKGSSFSRVLLSELTLRSGGISLIDRRKTPPAAVQLESLGISLSDITTLPEMTGGYNLTGSTGDGAKIKWRGDVSLDPVWSRGYFSLEKLRAATVWKFLKDRIASQKPPGEISLDFEYIFREKKEGPAFSMEKLNTDVSDFSVTLNDEQAPIMSIQEAHLRGGRLNLNKQILFLESLKMKGGVIRARKQEAGFAGWGRLIKTGKADEQPNGETGDRSDDQKKNPARGETGNRSHGVPTGWTASLKTFGLKDFQVFLTDLTTGPPLKLTLDQAGLTLSGLTTRPEAEAEFTFDSVVRQGGKFTARGSIKPWQGQGKGSIEIKDFSLPVLQPYINRKARLILESGSLGISGHFTYDRKKEAGAFSYKGRGELSSVSARTEDEKQPIWGWESIASPEINVSFSPVRLEADEVRITGPSGKLEIAEDGTLNLSHILIDGKEKKEEKKKKSSGAGVSLAVNRVRLDRGSLEFSDFSLDPDFEVRIHKLNGTVSGFSTGPGTSTRIEMKGQVNRYGQVNIQGKTDLSSPSGSSKANMVFRNIEMTGLTPYSIHFAGYRIASGKLTLNLEYTIKDGKMIGSNQITAEKLTLGEKVESPTALNIPIHLALALLKDSSGTIDVALPVSGNIRNPQFSFSDIIRAALSSLLKKIVTSPFSWLAALVGSEKENLDTILFEPGRADLPPPARERLSKVSAALDKRPGLLLQIRGGYSRRADAPVLERTMLRSRVSAKKGETLKPGESAGPPVFHDPGTRQAIESVFKESYSPDELSRLKEQYRKKLEPEKQDLTGKQGAAAWFDFYRDLYKRLEDKIEITEEQLKGLAKQRASAVRNFLVKDKNEDPDRITTGEPMAAKSGGGNEVISKLSVEASE